MTRWTRSGGQVVAPPVEDVGHLLHAPEPGGDPALARGVADLLEEARVADRAAVLDVLLPLGRDLADQVAHGEHDVDLGAVGWPSDSSARPTCAREAVARISWLMIAVPRPGADLAASRSQAPTASVSSPPQGSRIRSRAARKWASNRSAG